MTLTEQAQTQDGLLATDPTTPVEGRRQRRLAAESASASPATARPPLAVGRVAVAWVLACVSLLAFGFVGYALLLSPVQEQRSQAVLYHTLREQLALQTAPLGGPIKPGTVVALLSAPEVGIVDQVVVEGTASGDLMAGPGHRRDTVLPGQAGVSVLYGRATLFGAPFGRIAGARSGDRITVTTGQGVFTYVVQGVRRARDPMPQPLHGLQGRLTLVTSTGEGRFAGLMPDGAVYLDAALTGDGQATLPGRPAAVPLAEQAMQGDPSALLGLALALPLLLIGVLVTLVGWTRWGRWQTWVIGLPLVVLGLWMSAQAAIQLFPNLL